MEGIILAGGFGRRLRSVVSDVPKPMAPVCGRPFLDVLLSYLMRKGFSRLILSVGYKAKVIRSYFDDLDCKIDIRYAEELTPLGTGGAIAEALRQTSSDSVFVFNGDTFIDLEFSEICGMWSRDHRPVVVARAVPDTERFGRIECQGDRILRFLGSGVSGPGLVNAGCYLIARDVFAGMNLRVPFSFESDFLSECPDSFLRVFESRGTFIDIGVPEDYARAQTILSAVARAESGFHRRQTS